MFGHFSSRYKSVRSIAGEATADLSRTPGPSNEGRVYVIPERKVVDNLWCLDRLRSGYLCALLRIILNKDMIVRTLIADHSELALIGLQAVLAECGPHRAGGCGA